MFHDPNVYFKRKEVAEKRLKSVMEYVQHDSICRSRLLLAYFGEKNSADCGSCDICLKNKRLRLSQAEFDKIAEAVKAIRPPTKDIKLIVKQLCTQFDEDKIVKVVRWLVDNRKLKVES